MTNTNNSTLPVVEIFTDGGCVPNPGLGGYAAILTTVDKHGKSHELIVKGAVPDTTNQRMELLAAVSALESLKLVSKVILTTDSNYVVKGANEWMDGWLKRNWRNSKNKEVEHVDLWKRLHEQMQKHQIEFVWVKGHAGHEMNERADGLVAEARDEYLKKPAQPTNTTDTPATGQSTTTTTSDRKKRVMIAGSRDASQRMLVKACEAVDRAVEQGYQIIVGDAAGVDAEVVRRCNEIGYTNVIVVGIAAKPRNGGVTNGQYLQRGRSYTERDQIMVKATDIALFIGESKGTLEGYNFALSLNKEATLLKLRSNQVA